MTDIAEPSTTEAAPQHRAEPVTGTRIIQRTILQADQELDVRPLYVGGVSSVSGGGSSMRQSGASQDDDSAGVEESVGPDVTGAPTRIDENGAHVKPGRRITFGTYFNAFPAAYWRRWTTVEEVKLSIVCRGQGSIIVYRSTSKGHVQRAESTNVDTGNETTTIEIDLSLKPFIDGGWYWFDIEGGHGNFTMESAVWSVETERTRQGKASIGITTFNRPDFCTAQLLNLADKPEVLDVLDEIIVVDQGTQKVRDHEDFPAAAEMLGERLRIIEQGNLGGSGGFSRAMMETADKDAADYVLLLDDDVVVEPEGIRRAIAFADLAKQPTIVGGHMFSLYVRSVLHAYGEQIAKYRWFWGPAAGTQHGYDFASRSLRNNTVLHRRVDVDYNGWWMCLIPVETVREIGLSLPMFIKWDDAEYGLRAGEAGYPTVTLPGAAVWHVPWTEKDDTVDWQAYFHNRNRLISGLLHSPYAYGGRLIRELMLTYTKHMLSMQYSPAAMCLMAIEDVLEGPQRMHRDLRERLPELREFRKTMTDSISRGSLDDYPAPRRAKPPRRGKSPSEPHGRLKTAKALTIGALRQTLPVRELAKEHPEAGVAHVDQRWWRLVQLDSALVSSADGGAAFWYKRDRATFWKGMQKASVLHARLTKEWPALAETYRAALPDLVSPEVWQQTFDKSPAQEPSAAASTATASEEQGTAGDGSSDAASQTATPADAQPGSGEAQASA